MRHKHQLTDSLTVEKVRLAHDLSKSVKDSIKRFIKQIEREIDLINTKIQEKVVQNEDLVEKIKLLQSFKGVGNATATMLALCLPELGELNRAEIARLLGVAPINHDSGNKKGYERVQEIENPELASDRAREIYKAKGYNDAWIEKRMRGIQVRSELTQEWKNRDVGDTPEYAILTAEISKATFGMTPSEYKNLKSLKRENLRDHMTDLELIFTMLGEASATEIARNKDAQGFNENKTAARAGGKIAGKAR